MTNEDTLPMLKKYNALRISSRLAILMSILSILSTAVIASSVYYLWTAKIKTSVHQRLNDRVSISVESVERILTFKQQNLKAWAKLDNMIDILSQDVDLRIMNTLKVLKQNYRINGELVVINNKKNVIASTNNNTEYILNQYQRSLLISTNSQIQLPSLEDVASDVILIEPIIIPQLGEQPSGYIMLTYPMRAFFTTITKTVPNYQMSDGDFVRQRLSSKLSINHQPRSHLVGQTELPSTLKNLLITDWRKIKIGNSRELQIRALEKRETAFAPVYETLWTILRISFFMILVIIVIAIMASKRFVLPIIKLQKFGQDVSTTGRLDLDININSKDEIGDLAKILKQMMSNLDESFKQNETTNIELTELTLTLEERVDERTHALSLALKELKHAQSQLVQSEKMSSLGQLVAGIAHELNNPISAIYTNIPILDEYFTLLSGVIIELKSDNIIDHQQLFVKLEEIEFDYISEDIYSLLRGQKDSAERIRDIVLSLRNFSRLDEGELKRVDLHQGIDSTINILRHEIKNRIEVHRDYQLEELVECFPGEINQVFMNILSNACQAIKERGNVWIRTRKIENDLISIEIEDDGGGINKKDIDKLFDPFFTTKPVGTGTGLGLSISYNIIVKHKGSIKVIEGSKNGAIFSIKLPLKQRESNEY